MKNYSKSADGVSCNVFLNLRLCWEKPAYRVIGTLYVWCASVKKVFQAFNIIS